MQEIMKLKAGEKFVMDCAEGVCNKLKLLVLQRQAYENLFQSYLNKTNEMADNFNLEAFMYAYSKVYIAEKILVDETVEGFGIDLRELRQAGVSYMVNYFEGKLIFIKPVLKTPLNA